MKKIFTIALSAMLALPALAQEDVTSYIQNPGFDEDLTFQADGTMKEAVSTTTSLSDRSWAYIAADSTVYARPKDTSNASRPDGRKLEAVNGFNGQVKGWTLESNSAFSTPSSPNCEWTFFGSVSYDLSDTAVPVFDDGNGYLLVPARPTEFEGGDGFVYLRAGWGRSAVYKQVMSLPSAVYRLEYWTININPKTTAVAEDLTQISCLDRVFKDANATGMQSQVWTKHGFEFIPIAEFSMQFGYKAANAGSGGQPIVGLDGIKLYKIGEAECKELSFDFDEESLTATVTGISEEYAESLTELVIPSMTVYDGQVYTVTAIEEMAFMDRTNIVSVSIPSTVTSIGEWAFGGCFGIEEFKVDEGNPVYDSRNDCNALIETETNTLVSAFATTVIPEGITTIGDDAYQNVEYLSSISIPASVNTIGAYAFFLTNLDDVYCYATTVPELGEQTFSVSEEDGKVPATLHVPASMLEAYQTAAGWQNFREIVAITEPAAPAPVAVATEIEYFVNNDPGLGKGTVSGLSLDETAEQPLAIDESELLFGLNTLGLRLKTTFDNGSVAFSPTILHYVYRYHTEDATTNEVEYFVGKDPGIGKATRVSITPNEKGSAPLLIPETALRYGLNTLGVRLISRHGSEGAEEYSYSPTVLHSVYRYHAKDAHTIGVEYWLNGGEKTFISTTSDEVNLTIDREEMKEGINVLALRAVSQNSETGITRGATLYRYVYKPAANGQRDIERIEYFWDVDPGKGNGTAVEFQTVRDSAVVDCNISYAGIYGAHVLNIRALSHGVWSTLYQQAVILPTGILTGDVILDPEVEEDTDNGVFNLLSSLLGALSTRGFDIGLNVNVADATYNFPVTEQSIAVVKALYGYLVEKNFYISMKAPHSAVFNFMMDEEFYYTHQSELQQIGAAVQAMFSHIVTENISVLINGQPYQYDGFQVEPNDLLALKNLYNRLGGEKWTEKKWSFHSNGRDTEELPGVEFNDAGRVTSINLSGNNLQGELTKEWNLLLPELTYLNLSENYLSGDLAPFVSELTKLTYLNVLINDISEISSPLPSSIEKLDIRGQFRKAIDGVPTLDIEYTNKLSPVRVYISRKQTLNLPTVFTYNHSTLDYSNRPYLAVVNYGTSITSPIWEGKLSWINDHYEYEWLESGEYHYQQDFPVYLELYNPNLGLTDGITYPAKLRYMEGDANMSGYTDVLDVQHTLNYALAANVKPFNYSAANTYADETINVQDIVCTVNIVLDSESSIVGEPDIETGGRAMALIPQAWLYTKDGRLMLAADAEVGAIDVELSGVSTSQVSLLLNHSQFQMIGRNTERGSRYVIFSPTGESIPAGEVSNLLKISGNATITASKVSDMNAEAMSVSTDQQPTDIATLLQGSGLSAHFMGDQLVVKAAKEMSNVDLRLTTAGGATVMSTRLNHLLRGETTVDARLQAGVYVLEMTSKDGYRKIVKLMKR